MAVTSKILYRGSAATSNTTLYTQPNTSTTTIVTSIMVANASTSAATYNILIDGVDIANAATVAANDTIIIDTKQVIPASNPAKTITGSASATTVRFHISGVEVV